MTLTNENKAVIRRQVLAFRAKHPAHRSKHIVEAFEAAWSETLSDSHVAAASAYAEQVLREAP